MSESTSVMDHINNLNTLFSQLTASNYTIAENERVELLLQSLPDSYDQLVINITNNINNIADREYLMMSSVLLLKKSPGVKIRNIDRRAQNK